jgi:hypothetical protein
VLLPRKKKLRRKNQRAKKSRKRSLKRKKSRRKNHPSLQLLNPKSRNLKFPRKRFTAVVMKLVSR